MPREFPRTRRVGEQIQRELSVLLREEIQDPRLGIVSVSGVEVSSDLSHANVFVSVLGNDTEAKQSMQVLGGATGYLRRLLGKRLIIRAVPLLHFRLDRSLEQGAHMSALIDKAVRSDRSKDNGEDQDN